MAKTSIGLDIGSSAVRACELRLGDRPTLTRLGEVTLPSGSVVEGEVVEPGDVAGALRSLWKEANIKGKAVRVGVPLSRAIVRTIEVADLPDGDLRSMIGLELSDHVPLDPAHTAFDILPLDRIETDDGRRRRVLLAAAPNDAIEPTLAAVQQAGLTVAAVDVAPLALARVFTPEPILNAEGVAAASVDMVVSVGAGTMLALICTAGHLLFNRKATSPVGAQLTERIQYQLSVGADVAELTKRRVITSDNRHLLARVNDLADTVLDELVGDIQESISFYQSQAGARPLDRIVLTGGGSLLAGLDFHLAERLSYPVIFGDPFEGLTVAVDGLTTQRQDELEPYAATAIAYALGGGGRYATLDLKPKVQRQAIRPGQFALGAFGVVALGSLGMLYFSAHNEMSSVRSELVAALDARSAAAARLEELRSQGSGQVALSKESLDRMVTTAETRRIDWATAYQTLDTISQGVGVTLRGFSGVSTASGAPAVPGVSVVGSVSFGGTVSSLDVLAGWIATIEADERFISVTTPSVSDVLTDDQSTTIYQFEANVNLTTAALFNPPDPDATPVPPTPAASEIPADPETTVAG